MSQIKSISFFVFVSLIIGNVFSAPIPPNDPQLKAAILNYGRGLNRDISQSVMKNILSFNNGLKQYAATIPHDSILHDLVLPLHFTANMGNMGAPYIVKRFVSKPIEKATVSAAEWIDYYGGNSDIISSFVKNYVGSDRKMVRRTANPVSDVINKKTL